MHRSHARSGSHRPLRFEAMEPRLLLSATWTGLDRVRAEYGLTGQGQTVAVIDSGVDYLHSALGGGFGAGHRVVGGFDFAEGDADPNDDGPAGGHGTHVAGIIASDAAAHPGVAPGVDVVALRVFDDSGAGSLGDVQQALAWIHANRNAFRWPITTVSVALGVAGNFSTLPDWAWLEDDLAQLEADGIFVAVATGNAFTSYNQPGANYPAVSPHVVPVASADTSGSLSKFSQRDARSLVAPGGTLVSTVPDYDGNRDGVENDFASYSGTSMAAGYVSGAGVLLREACQLAGMQNITEQQLYNIMLTTADTIHDPVTGRDYHRINIGRAIDSVVPRDDFGSSERAASELGSLADARTISGAIERIGDSDWFRFIAAQSGKVTLRATASGEMQPDWKLSATLKGATRGTDGTLTLDVVAGQKYAFGLASRAGVGWYTIETTVHATPSGGGSEITTPPPQETHYRIDTAGAWITVTAPGEGTLSIQALFPNAKGDVDLQLFDAAGRFVAASSTTGDTERVEVSAAAGQKFLLHAYTYPGSGTNDQVDLLASSLPSPGRTANKALHAMAVDLVFGTR